ncbi:hypothetical protein M440DRAFT_1350888 [Trichoderma longibrachiatum ATCC 18648]|uniref:Uncharacterized protein n=1 Tax=Trichoderma longibrachiatum ATCC 18648 TaxID=983965 RepID=A0A2T4CE30_TRILO|nr:hypothetical protein M440DRAFT_1350888 [Trichoderma longibrachiatum ATCC 18648]
MDNKLKSLRRRNRRRDILSKFSDEPKFVEHVRVSPQCGICIERIFDEEPAMVLYGKDATYNGHLQPFPFHSMWAAHRQSDDYLICRARDCSCTPACEYTAVHRECYKIFLRFCGLRGIRKKPALQALWLCTAWKVPWPGALPMQASHVPADAQSLQLAGRLIGLPFLHLLPPELLLAVWGASKHALFWKCVASIRLVAQLEASASELQVVPLDQVLSWNRGGELESAPVSAVYPITRLTIDQEGIVKVERLRCMPRFTAEYHSHSTFVVEDGASLCGIEAQLQNGRLRLRFTPFQLTRPYIWNTPAPPPLSLCRALVPGSFDSRRFQVVDTQKIRGITFFFIGHKLYNIHIHHSDKSSAYSVYEQFSYAMRQEAVWIYLPLPSTDRLLVLGTRFLREGVYNLLVRMEKAGDVVVGQNRFFKEGDIINKSDAIRKNLPYLYSDQCLSANGPVTLVYGEPKEGFTIPLMGSYCASPTQQPPRPFGLEKPSEPLAGYGYAPYKYYSRAPLSHVTRAAVFLDPDHGVCQGVLLHYENGGCRTVGACRVNVHASETVDAPTLICTRAESPCNFHTTTSRVRIKFLRDAQHDELDKGWKCRPLEGFLEFLYHNGSASALVTKAFHEDLVRPLEVVMDMGSEGLKQVTV